MRILFCERTYVTYNDVCYHGNITGQVASGVFRISARRGRGAVGVEGLGHLGVVERDAPPQKKIIFIVIKMISLGAFLSSF